MTQPRLLGRPHPALDLSVDLAAARAQVVAAHPGPPEHEANRRQILDFLDAHPDALHRSCAQGQAGQSRRFGELTAAQEGARK